MNRTTLNREVNVTGYSFRPRSLQTFPSQIEIDNQRVTFIDQGMQYLVQKGQHLVRLFDASDGNTNYRLKYDSDEMLWTLVYTTSAQRA